MVVLHPRIARELGIVAAYLLDETLGVLAADKHFEFDAEREVGRDGVIEDGVVTAC
jgi:hypothetical protein